jgi:hypothetical protein
MNIYPEENRALKKRILYELKHALWSANFAPAQELVEIGGNLGMKGVRFWFYKIWAGRKWDISWLYLQLT